MSEQRSMDELHQIGWALSTQLPPVSSPQAMFLYAIQLHIDSEQRFRELSSNFEKHQENSRALETRVTELEKGSKEQKASIVEKEARIGLLERQAQAMPDEDSKAQRRVTELEKRCESLEAVKNSMEGVHETLLKHEERIATSFKRSASIEKSMLNEQKIFHFSLDNALAQTAGHTRELDKLSRALESNQVATNKYIKSMDEHIGVLFDERDCIVKRLDHGKDHVNAPDTVISVAKMEELIDGHARLTQLEASTPVILAEFQQALDSVTTTTKEDLAKTGARLAQLEMSHSNAVDEYKKSHDKLTSNTNAAIFRTSTRLTNLERASSQNQKSHERTLDKYNPSFTSEVPAQNHDANTRLEELEKAHNRIQSLNKMRFGLIERSAAEHRNTLECMITVAGSQAAKATAELEKRMTDSEQECKQKYDVLHQQKADEPSATQIKSLQHLVDKVTESQSASEKKVGALEDRMLKAEQSCIQKLSAAQVKLYAVRNVHDDSLRKLKDDVKDLQSNAERLEMRAAEELGKVANETNRQGIGLALKTAEKFDDLKDRMSELEQDWQDKQAAMQADVHGLRDFCASYGRQNGWSQDAINTVAGNVGANGTQMLRVVSANSPGQRSFDLSVAKGSGFVSRKENRKPGGFPFEQRL